MKLLSLLVVIAVSGCATYAKSRSASHFDHQRSIAFAREAQDPELASTLEALAETRDYTLGTDVLWECLDFRAQAQVARRQSEAGSGTADVDRRWLSTLRDCRTQCAQVAAKPDDLRVLPRDLELGRKYLAQCEADLPIAQAAEQSSVNRPVLQELGSRLDTAARLATEGCYLRAYFLLTAAEKRLARVSTRVGNDSAELLAKAATLRKSYAEGISRAEKFTREDAVSALYEERKRLVDAFNVAVVAQSDANHSANTFAVANQTNAALRAQNRVSAAKAVRSELEARVLALDAKLEKLARQKMLTCAASTSVAPD